MVELMLAKTVQSNSYDQQLLPIIKAPLPCLMFMALLHPKHSNHSQDSSSCTVARLNYRVVGLCLNVGMRGNNFPILTPLAHCILYLPCLRSLASFKLISLHDKLLMTSLQGLQDSNITRMKYNLKQTNHTMKNKNTPIDLRTNI